MDEDLLFERRRISALMTRLFSERASLGRMEGMSEDNRRSRETEIQAIGVLPNWPS